MQNNELYSSGRMEGITVATCAALSIVGIAFHPVVTNHAPSQAMAQVQNFAGVDQVVHGSLIVVSGLLLWCLAIFAVHRAPNRGLGIGGFLAYGFGTAGLVGAALIDGFVAPAIAARFAHEATPVLQGGPQLLAFSAIGVQVLTKFGVSAMSVGIFLWALALFRAGGSVRISGIIGIASAVLTVVFLLYSSSVSAHTLGVILIVQAVWYASIAYLLVRRAL